MKRKDRICIFRRATRTFTCNDRQPIAHFRGTVTRVFTVTIKRWCSFFFSDINDTSLDSGRLLRRTFIAISIGKDLFFQNLSPSILELH